MNKHLLGCLALTVIGIGLSAYIEPEAVPVVAVLGLIVMAAVAVTRREEGMYHLTSDEEEKERQEALKVASDLTRSYPG